MIKFNFNLFYIEKRINQIELSEIIGLPRGSVSIMEKRGTVKPSFIRKLETIYGDCSKYIMTDPQIISSSKVSQSV